MYERVQGEGVTGLEGSSLDEKKDQKGPHLIYLKLTPWAKMGSALNILHLRLW